MNEMWERIRELENRMKERERREYLHQGALTLAWSNAISMALAFPGLRALWCNTIDASGNLVDISGNGQTLTRTGVTYAFGGFASRCGFASASSRYLSRANASAAPLAITGLETSISTAFRGLTYGGWIQLLSLGSGSIQSVGGKYLTTGNQRSYDLRRTAANELLFRISNLGTEASEVSVTSPVVTVDTWHHVMCRFSPSASMDLFIDGVKYSNTTSIPASIFNSSADFNWGSQNNGGALYADMLTSIKVVCAMALSDAIIQAYYNHTRALFGV